MPKKLVGELVKVMKEFTLIEGRSLQGRGYKPVALGVIIDWGRHEGQKRLLGAFTWCISNGIGMYCLISWGQIATGLKGAV